MKTWTDEERRELQLKIEAATGLAFAEPLPEFFLAAGLSREEYAELLCKNAGMGMDQALALAAMVEKAVAAMVEKHEGKIVVHTVTCACPAMPWVEMVVSIATQHGLHALGRSRLN